jgi:hypothetical protein
MTQTTPIWKITATIGGTALTGAAVALNAQHIAHSEGWDSPLVAAAVIVTLCAACTPPFAERVAKTGQPAKAACLWLFFCLAVAFSLTSSIARSSGYASGKLAGVEQANTRSQLAQEAYVAAQAAQAAECVKRGPKCRAAEGAATAARNALAAAAPVQATDPGAERLAAVLGIRQSTVQLYDPLLLPLGLELGGFIFLAAGLAPRRSNGLKIEPVAKRSPAAAKIAADAVATAPKRGSAAYYQARLQRDHPALAQRVVAGEISVYKASIKAGLRKAPTRSAKWTKADAYTKLARVAGLFFRPRSAAWRSSTSTM